MHTSRVLLGHPIDHASDKVSTRLSDSPEGFRVGHDHGGRSVVTGSRPNDSPSTEIVGSNTNYVSTGP